MECPKCGHPAFYFNAKKQVGFCHSARCNWSPNRAQLDRILLQKGRRLFIPSPHQEDPPPVDLSPLAWPDDVVPLIEDDRLTPHCELCDEAIQRIEIDRRVPRSVQWIHALRASENRIYIPVYNVTEVVAYVGRAKWWIPQDTRRYMYPEGVSIQDFIFDWSIFQSKEAITFVENTFNALWLRPYNVTTNFGSHLGAKQLDLIRRSRVRQIVLLWDEGAELRAEEAVRKLRGIGVKALFVRLEGQPDQHTEECIASLVKAGHGALKQGAPRSIDGRHRPCLRGEA